MILENKVCYITSGNEKTKKAFNCILECEKKLQEMGYDIPVINYKITKNKLFGYCEAKNEEEFDIYINEYLLYESDEEIKNTVYHEIAHAIDMVNSFANGNLYFVGNTLYRKRGTCTPHGKSWKNIVNKISQKTGIQINITDEFPSNMENKFLNDAKFILQCPNCKHQYNYNRMCRAIKLALQNETDNGDSHIWCSDCGKQKGKLLLVKGKELVK